jgi:hypothetical protein
VKYYRLWALALFLKVVGAGWDASYHFKYLFEEYSLPHLTNFCGFVLGAVLLAVAFRKKAYMDVQARSIVLCGYMLFLIAIPLDFAYHLTFGIDLTTWSPTHFVYYVATALIILGVHLGYYRATDRQPANWRSLHSVFVAFWVEDLLFPCLQQENGSVALDAYLHHRSVASPEILELLKNPYAQIYGGVPEWVYPVYTAFVLSMLCWLLLRWLNNGKIAVVGTMLFLLFRYVACGIFAMIQYPTSFVPFIIVAIPLCIYALRRFPTFAAFLTATVYFGCFYAISKTGLLISPPASLWMILPVWLVSLVAMWVAMRRGGLRVGIATT